MGERNAMLRRLSIATRLPVTFGVLVCIIVGIGLFATATARHASTVFAAAARLNAERALAQQFEAAVQTARLATWSTLLTGDTEPMTQAGIAFKDAHARLADLLGGKADASRRDAVAGLKTKLDAYEANAARLVALRGAPDAFNTRENRALLANDIATAADIGAGAEALARAAGDAADTLTSDAQGTLDGAVDIAVVLAAGGVALGVLLALWVTGSIVRPVKMITDALQALAKGDFTVENPARGQAHEIGRLGTVMEALREQAIETRRLVPELVAGLPRRGKPTTGTILFDGDGMARGQGASADDRAPDRQLAQMLGWPVTVRNIAVDGQKITRCMLNYRDVVSPLFDHKAALHVIAVVAGEADLAGGRPVDKTYDLLTKYVNFAHAQGWLVVVSTKPERPDWPPRKRQALAEYNIMILRNKALADGVIDFANAPGVGDVEQRAASGLFQPDGINCNDQGYALLARMFADEIERLVELGAHRRSNWI